MRVRRLILILALVPFPLHFMAEPKLPTFGITLAGTADLVGSDLRQALLARDARYHRQSLPNPAEGKHMERDHNPSRAFSMPTAGR